MYRMTVTVGPIRGFCALLICRTYTPIHNRIAKTISCLYRVR